MLSRTQTVTKQKKTFSTETRIDSFESVRRSTRSRPLVCETMRECGNPPAFANDLGAYMGVAYYIELDNESLEVDCSDGKAVAKAMDELNALAEELGITPLEQFMGQSMEDISDMLDEDIELEDGSATWFEPAEGIAVLEKLIAVLQANPTRVRSALAVVEDLESYRVALQAAQSHRAKWHLAIDV